MRDKDAVKNAIKKRGGMKRKWNGMIRKERKRERERKKERHREIEEHRKDGMMKED